MCKPAWICSAPFCLEHNLLDFSLQLEIFSKILWQDELCRGYLVRSYKHLIFDNLEEDTPAAHDVLLDWLPHFSSALLIYDWDGGFRTFLGADAQSAYRFKQKCSLQRSLTHTWVPSPGIRTLGMLLSTALAAPETEKQGFPTPDLQAEAGSEAPGSLSVGATQAEPTPGPENALAFSYERYYPQMLDWVAQTTADLVHRENVPPEEIVILAPFMPDALRFNLVNRLQSLDVPVRSHRPSRSLRDEPAARCLLTLAALAFPTWGSAPAKSDVAYALMQAINGLDLVRARLLSEIVYQVRRGEPELNTFDGINAEKQERITYRLGERL